MGKEKGYRHKDGKGRVRKKENEGKRGRGKLDTKERC